MNNALKSDLYRLTGHDDKKTYLKMLFTSSVFRRLYCYRNFKSKGIKGAFARLLNHFLSKNSSLEIQPNAKLGEGVLFLHPYGITINSKAVTGKNLTMLKGSTIGNSKTGKIGAPVIGDNVYIGLNSSVVGGIKVGDNVMIAANTFVNFDVPDGALVIGCPGVIYKKENASKEYIVNPC